MSGPEMKGLETSNPSSQPELPMADHPSLETLLELSLGELEPAAAAPVAEHLRQCANCLARYGSLLELPDPSPGTAGEEAAEEEAQAAAWRELSRKLRLGEAEPEAETTVPPREQQRPLASRRSLPLPPAWIAAAALVPLAFLLGYLARGPAETAPPVLATAAPAQLMPGDFALLGTVPKAPPQVLCPPAEGVFSWVLTGLGPGAGVGALYEIGIERPDGGSMQEAGAVQQFGEIHLALQRLGLPNGNYRITVRLAPRAGGEEVKKEYRLTLDCP